MELPILPIHPRIPSASFASDLEERSSRVSNLSRTRRPSGGGGGGGERNLSTSGSMDGLMETSNLGLTIWAKANLQEPPLILDGASFPLNSKGVR